MRTKERIRQNEGTRRFPYRCSAGRLTVGIGRNMDAVPFSDDEIELMFSNDFWRAYYAAQKLPGFEILNEARQGVLTEMVFQMGLSGVKKIRKFIAAYQSGDWQRSHDEMLDSTWRKQTPKRAKRLAEIFLSGDYDE